MMNQVLEFFQNEHFDKSQILRTGHFLPTTQETFWNGRIFRGYDVNVYLEQGYWQEEVCEDQPQLLRTAAILV